MPGSASKIWAIFSPSEKRKALWMLLLIIAMALAETLGVVSILPFLTVVGNPGIVESNSTIHAIYNQLQFSSTISFITALGLASIAAVVGSSIFKMTTLHVVNRFVQMQRHRLSVRLFQRYLNQPYEFFLENNPSTLTKNILSEVDQLIFDIIQPLSHLIAQGAVVCAMVVLIFVYDPLTAVGIVATVSLMYAAIYGLVKTRLATIGRYRQAANTGRYKTCNETLNGIKDVKATHASRVFLDIFEQDSHNFSRHTATGETLSYSPLYLVEAVGYSGLISIALVLMFRSGNIVHILPTLGLYGFAAYRLLPAAQIMYRGFARLRFSAAALEVIHHDLSLPTEAGLIGESLPDGSPKHEIRLRHVSFAYPSRPRRAVLDGFNLTIPANTCIAITGKSGAGKSTLMDILLGLLKPQSGEFSVDGVVITPSNAASWQRNVGYVPQHVYLSDATIAENIAFGVPLGSIDLQAIERAARAANIHDFIEKELPAGYNTMIGDRGLRLSGGQRQRVGIARALYRDPPVLLFDEATSALDIATEESVNRAIHGLAGKKTIILIAHRETSLRNCQQTVVIGAEGEKSTQ